MCTCLETQKAEGNEKRKTNSENRLIQKLNILKECGEMQANDDSGI